MKRGKVDNVSHQGTGQHYCGVIKPPSAEPMPEWRSEKGVTLIFDKVKKKLQLTPPRLYIKSDGY